MGQEMVFEDASQAIEKLTLVEVQAKQIERVCHYYGQQIEDHIWAVPQGCDSVIEVPLPEREQLHYVMADGGMILTREEKWKEMKVCRIFAARDQIEVSKDRPCITQSLYISHLGGHRDFFNKVEQLTDQLSQKIFIADGAKWIWNWVRETYPGAVQILDFFHAKEHLCQFASCWFKDDQEKKNWIDAQTLWLLNNGVAKVIDNLRALHITNGAIVKVRDTLINYYEANQSKMKYKTYRDNGWLIGSGAMEASHRHVIQQRMKLSGQRWTISGAQQIANLRSLKKSKQWHRIRSFMKNAA